ncbi:MAG: hypothetical protein N2512_12515 [Armatimonadetes bacterium]|nr:hypothetical protein [Armatimonadota bacterium]
MHWPLIAVGQACVIAAAMFCMAREKNPLKLLAGATAGAATTLAVLVLLGLVAALSSRAGWLELVSRWFRISAGFLGSTVFGTLAGAAVAAFVTEPVPARTSAYVGGLIGLAIAGVPVVFLYGAWPGEIRSAVAVGLLCQGLIAGTLMGRGVGMKAPA